MTRRLIRDDKHIVGLNGCHKASWTSPCGHGEALEPHSLIKSQLCSSMNETKQNEVMDTVEKCN